MIQTYDDIFRACINDFRGNWDKYLPLVEFACNSSFHSSISMTSYESLYGCTSRSPIGWFEVGEPSLLGLELIYKTFGKGSYHKEPFANGV